MQVSVAILLGWTLGGLVVAWSAAVTRFYRSEKLASMSEGARVAVAALVGFVFVLPVTLVGCWHLASKAVPTLDGHAAESEVNSLRDH
jgi:hypothetical protein